VEDDLWEGSSSFGRDEVVVQAVREDVPDMCAVSGSAEARVDRCDTTEVNLIGADTEKITHD